jgi:hypothetical protein
MCDEGLTEYFGFLGVDTGIFPGCIRKKRFDQLQMFCLLDHTLAIPGFPHTVSSTQVCIFIGI